MKTPLSAASKPLSIQGHTEAYWVPCGSLCGTRVCKCSARGQQKQSRSRPKDMQRASPLEHGYARAKVYMACGGDGEWAFGAWSVCGALRPWGAAAVSFRWYENDAAHFQALYMRLPFSLYICVIIMISRFSTLYSCLTILLDANALMGYLRVQGGVVHFSCKTDCISLYIDAQFQRTMVDE